ncbi:MAG: hypothetical protein RJA47_708 [Actinomycetota bacterium]
MNDTDSRVPNYDGTMLAHQGGWDELLYVLVPIGFIFFLLRVANSRAKKLPPPSAPPSSDGSD